MKWVVVLLVVALAGCTKAEPEPLETIELMDETGVLMGRVVDVHVNPVEGATISWEGGTTASQVTSETGAFRFERVPSGGVLVKITKPSHQTVSLHGVPGTFLDVQVQRVLDPSVEGYVNEYQFNGRIECSTTAFSPCGLLTEVAGIGEDTYASLYETESNIAHLQTEIVWESTQELGDSFDVTHRYATREQFEGGLFEGTLVRGVGPSPLLVITDEKKYNRESVGENFQFMLTVFAGATEDTPLLGVAASQDYEVFVHEFHGKPPPLGWRFTETGL